jgi:hypothetical protein
MADIFVTELSGGDDSTDRVVMTENGEMKRITIPSPDDRCSPALGFFATLAIGSGERRRGRTHATSPSRLLLTVVDEPWPLARWVLRLGLVKPIRHGLCRG